MVTNCTQKKKTSGIRNQPKSSLGDSEMLWSSPKLGSSGVKPLGYMARRKVEHHGFGFLGRAWVFKSLKISISA